MPLHARAFSHFSKEDPEFNQHQTYRHFSCMSVPTKCEKTFVSQHRKRANWIRKVNDTIGSCEYWGGGGGSE